MNLPFSVPQAIKSLIPKLPSFKGLTVKQGLPVITLAAGLVLDRLNPWTTLS